MWRYLASRLVQIPLILVVVTMTIFVVVRATPGDPVQIMLGMETSPDAVAAIRKEFRLDRPLAVQYVLWLGDLAQGNLGRSIRLNTPVTQLLRERFPVSLRLAAGAMLVALCISIPLGILAALYRNTWIDYLCTGYTVAGFAIPNFALAMILIYVFSIKLGWFPITGIGSGDAKTAFDAIGPYILPAVALGTLQTAVLTRLLRSSMIDRCSCARPEERDDSIRHDGRHPVRILNRDSGDHRIHFRNSGDGVSRAVRRHQPGLPHCAGLYAGDRRVLPLCQLGRGPSLRRPRSANPLLTWPRFSRTTPARPLATRS
jgi:hypothetical protein